MQQAHAHEYRTLVATARLRPCVSSADALLDWFAHDEPQMYRAMLACYGRHTLLKACDDALDNAFSPYPASVAATPERPRPALYGV